MEPKYSISLVIPAYNEEEIIISTLETSKDYLHGITENFEIIIIDDGSTDKTGEIIDEFASRQPHIKCIHNILNEGSGKSLFIGLRVAQYDFIITNFADLPFDIKELNNILPLFDNPEIDFVIVTRKDRKANSIYRKITSLANYWLIRMLFFIKVGDFSFVQIYRKRVLKEINVQSRGTFVPPEIIIKALNSGYKAREYSTYFYPRRGGKAKCGHPKTIIQSICEIIKFWFKWEILKHKE